MQFRHFINLTITLFSLSMGIFYNAEAATIDAGHATMSWTGQGVIDDLGDGERVFKGTITGHIPREASSRGLDAAGDTQRHQWIVRRSSISVRTERDQRRASASLEPMETRTSRT